ncbi:MAG: diguanylate cyclase [Pseudorhodobacter sp.]|nr:diguanylate cyclase [Pseudorhodobacter sp.]
MPNANQHRRHATRMIGMTVAAIALAALAILAIVRLPAPVVERLLQDDVRAQAALWQKRLLVRLTAGPDTFVNAAVTFADHRILDPITLSSDIYRFKLLDADGGVFWSSRPADIGVTVTAPYFAAVVAQGAVYYQLAAKPAAEVDGLSSHTLHLDRTAPRLVAEIYTPVVRDGVFIGAIEFYDDVTDTHATFVARVRTVITAIAAAGGLLFVVSMVVVLRAGRVRLREVSARAATEHDLMQDQTRLMREVRLLGELNEWLQSSRSLEELFAMVARFMGHLMPDSSGSIYVYSNSRDVLDGAASWNGGAHDAHIHPEDCWGLRRGRTYAYGHGEIEFTCAHVHLASPRPYVCFPILAHGETVGMMHLMAQPGTSLADFDAQRRLAQMSAEQISLAIANVRMRDQLHHQAIRDPLTGLFNRRHMTDTLRRLIETRAADPFSVISIDIDHFKLFNDNHGHDAGDMVLRAVGEALMQSCDGDEIACRIGGEELMLLLPTVELESAAARAEAVRLAVAAISVRYGDKTLPRISISIGVAQYPAHGRMPQDVIRAADDALYAAKAKGRNQVVLAGVAPELGRTDAAGSAPARALPAAVPTTATAPNAAASASADAISITAPHRHNGITPIHGI